MKRLLFLLSILCSLSGCAQQVFFHSANGVTVTGGVTLPSNPLAFPFTLPATSDSFTTSSGMYKVSDNSLVRTLWGNVRFPGNKTYTVAWDGKDDLGDTVTAACFAQVLRNNVKAGWDGVIGNTSNLNVGTRGDLFRFYNGLFDAVTIGDSMYYSTGWAEGNTTIWAKSNTNINAGPVPMRPSFTETDITTDFIATDGTNIYCAGFDTQTQDRSWIYAIKVSDHSDVIFSNGTARNATVQGGAETGKHYVSTIDYRVETSTSIPHGYTALSVQTSGNFIFSLRGQQNLLRILDKTGAIVDSVTVVGATAMRNDLSNGLWIAFSDTIKKYTVDATTAHLTATGIVINTGLSRVTYMTMNVGGSVLTVMDAGANQQVKGFDNTTGSLLWTLGQSGGYQTNALAAYDKFFIGSWPIVDPLGDARFGEQVYPFVTYQSDGKLWVGDFLNNRALRFTTSRAYDTMFMVQPGNYATQVHPSDSTRILVGGYAPVEFKIDYTKTLDHGINGSWRFNANWSAPLSSYYDKAYFPVHLTKFPNGHVYGTLLNRHTGLIEMWDFMAGGTIRNTGITFNNRFAFHTDGSLILAKDVVAPNPYEWKKVPLTGYTGVSGADPNWSITSPINFDGAPSGTKYISIVKSDFDPYEATNTDIGLVTADGKQVTFDGATEPGHHLGFIKLKTDGTVATSFQIKTALNTRQNYLGEFPKDGRYDNGNNVGQSGGDVRLFNYINLLLFTYHGEFWKTYQTNYYSVYHKSGLPVIVFGTFSGESSNDIAAGQAGNVFVVSLVDKNGDTSYLFTPDDNVHSAIHRWTLSNLSSVHVDTIALGTSNTVDTLPGIDLMAGLMPTYTLYDDFGDAPDALVNGTAGWSRTPTTNYLNSGTDFWNVVYGTKTYDKSKPTDIFIKFRKPPDYSIYEGVGGVPGTFNPADIPTLTSTVTRDLTVDAQHNRTYNTTGSTSWTLTGKINYDGIFSYNNGTDKRNGGGQFMNIRDTAGKIIARLYPRDLNDGSGNASLFGNNTAIFTKQGSKDFFRFMSLNKDFSIHVDSTGVDYKVADYTIHTSIVDSTADWHSPKTLEFDFWQFNDDHSRYIGVSDLRAQVTH